MTSLSRSLLKLCSSVPEKRIFDFICALLQAAMTSKLDSTEF